MKLIELIASLVIVCFIAAILALIYNQYLDCSAQGGDFVRTVFWYACLL